MKKLFISAAISGVAAFALMANSDHIELNFNGLKKIWIDDVETINVAQTQGVTDGFNTLQIYYKDGKSDSWLIGGISDMKWVNGYKPTQISLEAVPHHRCITLNCTSPDPEVKYSFGALPMSYFEGKSEHEYHDIILNYERQLINDYAASLGKNDVSELNPDYVFTCVGNGSVTWFPATTQESIAMPGKEYVAYLYQGNITPEKGLVLEHDVVFQKVTTKTISYADVDYNITVTTTPSRIKAHVTTDNSDPFAIFIIPEAELGSDLDATAAAQISNLEYSVYNGGPWWDECTYVGEGEATSKLLRSGDKYYVLVVGCEYGTMTSHPKVSDLVTVPFPGVTDNCTFAVTAEEVSTSEINLTVTPSNAETAYVTFMEEKGKVTDARAYFAHLLYSLHSYPQFSFVPSESNLYVFKGTKTINSITNLWSGKQMMEGKTYVFYTMGINEEGTPTTAINEFEYTPGPQQQTMTFDMTFDTANFDMSDNSDWAYRKLNYKLIPSDKEMQYVFASMIVDRLKIDGKTDREIMDQYVASMGSYLTTKTGDLESYVTFSKSYEYPTGYIWKETYIMFFGYDGAPTSELYLYKFNPGTGLLEQLRGPGAN